jgi:uracil-DNA glycosylase
MFSHSKFSSESLIISSSESSVILTSESSAISASESSESSTISASESSAISASESSESSTISASESSESSTISASESSESSTISASESSAVSASESSAVSASESSAVSASESSAVSASESSLISALESSAVSALESSAVSASESSAVSVSESSAVSTLSKFELPIYMCKYDNLSDFLNNQKPFVSQNDILDEQIKHLENTKILNELFTISPSLRTSSTSKFLTYKVPPTWESIFDSEIGREEIEKSLSRVRNEVIKGYNIFPLEEDLFRAFHLCPKNKLKVVIIGQDPYPTMDNILNIPKASGLSFSGRKGGELPVSLKTIFKEISRTFPGIPLEHGDLTSWAEQGVLLLNASLTVNQGEAESHYKLGFWIHFIEYIIKSLSEEIPGLIFCLWGAKAKKFGNGNTKVIGRKSIILEAGHPSGLNTSSIRFAECGHFASIYYELVSQKKVPINWALIK